MAKPNTTALEADLHWACQWLLLLGGDFPSADVARAALRNRGLSPRKWETVLTDAARLVVDGTRHLSSPSLDALRKHFPEESGDARAALASKGGNDA